MTGQKQVTTQTSTTTGNNFGCALSAILGFWVVVGVLLGMTHMLAQAMATPAVQLTALATVGVPVVLYGVAAGVGALNRRVNARILEQVLRPAGVDTAVGRVIADGPPPTAFAVDLFGHGRRPVASPAAAVLVAQAQIATAAVQAEFMRRLVRQGVVLLLAIVSGVGVTLALGGPMLSSDHSVQLFLFGVVCTTMAGPVLRMERNKGQPPAQTLVVLHLAGLLALAGLAWHAASALLGHLEAGQWTFVLVPAWLVGMAGAYVAGWRSGAGSVPGLTPASPVRLVVLWVFGTARHYSSVRGSLWQVWKFVGPGTALNGPGNPGRSPSLRTRLDLVRGRRPQVVLDTPELVYARVAGLRAPAPLTPTIWGDGYWDLAELRCSDNVWQLAVDQLLVDADVVLMNLSGFGPHNAGCTWELGELIDRIPTRSFVLMVDAATDLDFLYAHLRERWSSMAATSPNREPGRPPIQVYVSSIEEPLDDKVAYRMEMTKSGEMERRATPALQAWRERDELARKNVGVDVLALLSAGAAGVNADRGGLMPLEPAAPVEETAAAARRSGTLVTGLSASACHALLEAQLAVDGSRPRADASRPIAGEVNAAQFHIRRQGSSRPMPELVGQFASDGERTRLFVEVRDPEVPLTRTSTARVVRRARILVWVVLVLACGGVAGGMAVSGRAFSVGFGIVATILICGWLVAKILPGALEALLSLPIHWGWRPALAEPEAPASDAAEYAWLWQFLCETLHADFESDAARIASAAPR